VLKFNNEDANLKLGVKGGYEKQNREMKQIIAFVSKNQTFSDRICRVTEAELENIGTGRFTSLNHLMETLPDWKGCLRLVLIDAATAEDLNIDQLIWIHSQSEANIACAYCDSIKAQILLASELYPKGISSFFPIDMNLDAWVSMLRLCLSGQSYVTPELFLQQPHPPVVSVNDIDHILQKSLTNATKTSSICPKKDSRLKYLTNRENEVLEIVAEGCPNKTIASRLGLSENTIKLHIHNIIMKLGVHNRTEAAMIHASRHN